MSREKFREELFLPEAREELAREQNRVALLKEKPKFNDTNCILCLERFGIIFHRKRVCYRCQLNVCNKCCQPRSNKKDGLICMVCIKEKSYKILSNQWFYETSQTQDKHIGSSKIVRSLFKRNSSSLSDMEADSGYPHSSTNSAPAIKTRPRLDQVFDINVRHSSDQSDGVE
ncbi:rab effector MyRIP-like [Physella acuta]|uniref:rab effector MyRIP-like n=1 Tax=Physella acuta TaxID=109671 RepID=UPI0027DAD896|nr:rab effector MyRIP-like [Physella acuta]